MAETGVDSEMNEKVVTAYSQTSMTLTRRKKKRQAGLKTLFVSGVGFLADAYDLFVIDLVMAILTATAYNEPTELEKGWIASASLAGAVIGQLGFGFAADWIGRRTMFIATAALCIFGNIVCAVVGFGYRTSSPTFSIFHQLAIARLLLGIGIGGEYPLAATVASEADESDDPDLPAEGCCWFLEQKPNSIASVFSMQGVGMLLSPLFVMLLLGTGCSLELTWRLCLGVGAIPSAVAFYFRWKMHESASFKNAKRHLSLADASSASTALDEGSPTNSPTGVYSSPKAKSPEKVAKPSTRKLADGDIASKEPNQSSNSDFLVSNSNGGGGNKSSWARFGKHLKYTGSILNQYKWVLFGTSVTWFLIDVTFYGTGSFKSVVVGHIFNPGNRRLHAEDDEVRRQLVFPSSVGQLQRDALRSLLQTVVDKYSPMPESGDFSAAGQSVASRISGSLRSLVVDAPEGREGVFLQAAMAAVVACIAIPGYILSVFFIHKTGLRNLTLYGFMAVAVAYFVLGGEQFLKLDIKALEVFLFGLTFLFTNFGPNSSTFILPTTVYPTYVRATCHGFSAAMGKVGGVVGTNLFGVVKKSLGLAWLQTLCGFVAVLGAIVTYFFIPTDESARAAISKHNIELQRRADKALQGHQANSPGQIVNVAQH